ncbi:hypothetical protein C8Q80DRAFT_595690 [Daedaleopsis nitida]|nr:hypothetical protein C8Q80DRAFT_595690 [Daedaleopsis nitida]
MSYSVSIPGIPDWVKNHPEVKARGLDLQDALKPGVTWRTGDQIPPYVVKALNPAGQEADIYERLRSLDPTCLSHTLPGCDVYDTHSERPILIMPVISEFMANFPAWDLVKLLDCYHQILEGVEFLHDMKIAHLDFVTDNLLLARKHDVEFHRGLPIEVGKVYIMDFGESQQYKLGPGQQPAIKLPPSHIAAPSGMTHFDPYSWDVLCVGHAFQWISSWVYEDRPEPWIVRRLGLWLVGNERGCTSVCHCRPSARRARQVVSVIVWALGVSQSVRRAMRTVRGMFFARTSRAQD